MPTDLVGNLMVVIEHIDRERLLFTAMFDPQHLFVHANHVARRAFEPLLGDRQELEPANPIPVEQPIDERPGKPQRHCPRHHRHAGFSRDLEEDNNQPQPKHESRRHNACPQEMRQIHLPGKFLQDRRRAVRAQTLGQFGQNRPNENNEEIPRHILVSAPGPSRQAYPSVRFSCCSSSLALWM